MDEAITQSRQDQNLGQSAEELGPQLGESSRQAERNVFIQGYCSESNQLLENDRWESNDPTASPLRGEATSASGGRANELSYPSILSAEGQVGEQHISRNNFQNSSQIFRPENNFQTSVENPILRQRQLAPILNPNNDSSYDLSLGYTEDDLRSALDKIRARLSGKGYGIGSIYDGWQNIFALTNNSSTELNHAEKRVIAIICNSTFSKDFQVQLPVLAYAKIVRECLIIRYKNMPDHHLSVLKPKVNELGKYYYTSFNNSPHNLNKIAESLEYYKRELERGNNIGSENYNPSGLE